MAFIGSDIKEVAAKTASIYYIYYNLLKNLMGDLLIID